MYVYIQPFMYTHPYFDFRIKVLSSIMHVVNWIRAVLYTYILEFDTLDLSDFYYNYVLLYPFMYVILYIHRCSCSCIRRLCCVL